MKPTAAASPAARPGQPPPVAPPDVFTVCARTALGAEDLAAVQAEEQRFAAAGGVSNG